ncbi:hypothetical protein [Actinomadura flavalba]|uniref:hypothetical protein n=1 Tax=Actinomadura flavalba TaxID=1120938 RepID=UPI0012DD90DD|nr:hypothetical protein [Actinomadura flavalba]
MSVDQVLDERERLNAAWDEAEEDYLGTLRDDTRLTQWCEHLHGELAAIEDVQAAIAAAGAGTEGDRRQARTGAAVVTLRVRAVYERRIVTTTHLVRKITGLQHLAGLHRALLPELHRQLVRRHPDMLQEFQAIDAEITEFLHRHVPDADQRRRDAWRGAIETQRLAVERLDEIAPGSAATWRFNPPPTWPDPQPGWTPQPDWTPDPSWEIPPDETWHFWHRT